jgi:hypothetical protein
MPDIGDDKATATTYPPKSIYQGWCEEAETRSIPTSQYIIRMVEAARKDVSLDEAVSDSVQELRQQRQDLQNELDQQRRRVQKLEEQLHHSEQVDVLEYIEANPGVTVSEIIQHIADTVPSRVAGHLDLLQGESIERREGGYYPNATDENQFPSLGGADGPSGQMEEE